MTTKACAHYCENSRRRTAAHPTLPPRSQGGKSTTRPRIGTAQRKPRSEEDAQLALLTAARVVPEHAARIARLRAADGLLLDAAVRASFFAVRLDGVERTVREARAARALTSRMRPAALRPLGEHSAVIAAAGGLPRDVLVVIEAKTRLGNWVDRSKSAEEKHTLLWGRRE